MKKLLTYFGIAVSILLIIALISRKFESQAQEKEPQEETLTVAKLLNRSEKIQMGKEWEFVQNTYQKNKLKVNSDPQAYKEMLTLAELFIKEARVTGEHGHYYPGALQLCNNVIARTIDVNEAYQALVIKAGVELSLHDFKGALETGQKALALNNTSARIYGVLVDAHVELGHYEKAVEMADKMVSIKPDIRSYSRISYIRELYGDFDGAKEALSMAIKAGFPGYEETAWAMLTYGNLCTELGDLDQADKTYDQILSIRENYPFAIAAKAHIAYLKGDLERAERMLNESVAIIPEVHFYTQLAQIYKDQKREAEFSKVMDEIFLMLQDDVEAGHDMNLEYAHVYMDLLEDNMKAEQYAILEWIKRPDNVTVNRLMAKIALNRNEKEEAKKYFEIAASLNPDQPELAQLKSLL